MNEKKRILLKLTGEAFLSPEDQTLSAANINSIVAQIKQLSDTHQFGIVVGGGNFFRGRVHGKRLGMTPSVGHQVGMLSTMMNGLIIKDLLEQHGLTTAIFCAITCPQVGSPVAQQTIDAAVGRGQTTIFTGGTGNPFFTTDTTAVLRGLQIHADQIWKGTKVNGVYTADPTKDPHAQLLKKVTYRKALDMQLGIMDSTALALAQAHDQVIRVFDIFQDNALLKATEDASFGSTITTQSKEQYEY